MDTGKVIALTRRMIKKEFEEVGPYHYVGSVLTVDSLPTTGNKTGDVYNVGSTLDGGNYAWNGTAWDKLGDSGNSKYDVSSTVSASNGLVTIDLQEASVFEYTMEEDTTFMFTGVPINKTAVFSLIVHCDDDNYTAYWPANVYWSNETEPTLGGDGLDVLTFMTPDGGNRWFATISVYKSADKDLE